VKGGERSVAPFGGGGAQPRLKAPSPLGEGVGGGGKPSMNGVRRTP